MRNRRRRSSTSAEMRNRANAKKTFEPTEMGETDTRNMLKKQRKPIRKKTSKFQSFFMAGYLGRR